MVSTLLLISGALGASSCPKDAFETKHVCRTCRANNIADVNAFALQAHKARVGNRWQITKFTSVFVGNPAYNYKSPYCVFTQRITKYNCRNHGDTYTPVWKCYSPPVNFVIASHKLSSGHYENKLDRT